MSRLKDEPREPTSPLHRRRFLQALGLGAAGGGLAGCIPPRDREDPFALEKPPVPGAEKFTRFEEDSVLTACDQCPAGCGVRVRVYEGRAVNIAGEESNPINRGGIGPRGLSGLQALYDPDRITQPLRRRGGRGAAGSLEPISWDDALDELSQRLTRLREAGEPHRLGLACGRPRGFTLELFERFGRAFGTPNVFEGLSAKHGAVVQARKLTQGLDVYPAYDWGSTRYIVSFGAGILEASCQAVYFARAATHLRRGRPGDRAKVVQVEPSPSQTARQADEWISLRPGTDAAFALGLCHVLVRDGLHDAAFVEEHGFGFDAWTDEQGREHRGLADLLEADYSPEAVAAACGVREQTIERIAREMANERPAFAIVDEVATMAANGLHVAFAVQCLNALLGSVDRPGGVLSARPAPVTPWPELELDAVAERGLTQPRLDGAGTERFPLGRTVIEALPDALASGKPYGLDTLLLHYENPAYAGLTPKRWREALDRVPFVVSFSPFRDETVAEMADLVLPDHTYFERWEDSAPAPSVGEAVFGIRQPVVEPLHDTRQSGDVLIDLAGRLGGPVEDALDWKNFRALVLDAFKGLHEAQRGSIVEKKFSRFGRSLLTAGFWADEPYEFERWDEVLATPSGRFEFFSQTALAALEDAASRRATGASQLLAEWGRPDDVDLACLPHHVEPSWDGDAEKYPFVLEPYTPGTYSEGSGANLPYLQELVRERGHAAWTTTAEIAPETARRVGVGTGDHLLVRSPSATIGVRVALRDGMRPDIVRIPRGGGHSAFGRFAAGWGANVQDLLVPRLEPFGGTPAVRATRVAIARATA